MRFKVHWVQNGLLNFANHYSDDHSECSRWIWYCRCRAGSEYYCPHHKYVTEECSEEGERCNSMIKHFFKLAMYTVVFSRKFESILWKTVMYLRTSVNESLFHNLSFYIQKNAHCNGDLYVLKEAAAYLSFHHQQENNQLGGAKLVRNKNADGLIAVAKQAQSRDKPETNSAISAICWDFHSQAACCRRQKRQQERQRKRGEFVEKQLGRMSDACLQLSQSGKAAIRTYDGVIAKEQIAQPAAHIMPTLPFPYQNDSMLRTRGQEAELIAIYEKAVAIGHPADTLQDEKARQDAEQDDDHDDDDDDADDDAVQKAVSEFVSTMLA